MKTIKSIWTAISSLFSGFFTKLIDKIPNPNKDKFKIINIEKTKIRRNEIKGNFKAKNIKDSYIEDNKFK